MLTYIPAAAFVPPTNMPAPTLTLVFASAFYLSVLLAATNAKCTRLAMINTELATNFIYINDVFGSKIAAALLVSFGPRREKPALRRFASNKGAVQPAQTRCLISAFIIRCSESTISKPSMSEISIF